jgi:hypothetical protein
MYLDAFVTYVPDCSAADPTRALIHFELDLDESELLDARTHDIVLD